jgi:hypothetical protein
MIVTRGGKEYGLTHGAIVFGATRQKKFTNLFTALRPPWFARLYDRVPGRTQTLRQKPRLG